MVVGMPTPHDNEGTMTRKTLRSLTETEGWKASAVTSQVEDDFRERTQWQLGKTRDPLVYIALPSRSRQSMGRGERNAWRALRQC